MKFKDLTVGETFDWIKDGSHDNTFFLPCRKESARTYSWYDRRDNKRYSTRVGSVNAEVYHRGIPDNPPDDDERDPMLDDFELFHE